jgi:hypothetical protein
VKYTTEECAAHWQTRTNDDDDQEIETGRRETTAVVQPRGTECDRATRRLQQIFFFFFFFGELPRAMERECDSKRIESVRVYRPKWTAPTTAGAAVAAAAQTQPPQPPPSSSRKRKGGGGGWPRLNLYSVVFAVLYALQIGWVLSTVGEPYRTFLEKADREGFQGTKENAPVVVVVDCEGVGLPSFSV